MLKNILLLFVCCLLLASCDSFKAKEKTTEEQPPTSEYDQIPLIQNLTKQLEKDASNPQLYYTRAAAYFELGNQQNALSDAAKALQLDSTKSAYYELLGEIYFAKQ